jgi:hypothetical protein
MKKVKIAYAYTAFSFLAIAMVLSPNIAGIWDSSPSYMYIPMPSSLSGYFIRYINITTGQGSNLRLNITIPYSNEYQSTSLQVLSDQGYSKHEDYNRTWITLQISSSTSIELKYSFSSKAFSYPVSRYNSLNNSYIPSYLKEQYLGDEYLFGNEVIMPEMFKEITKKIVGNNTNVFDEEKAIYDYIVKNFKYKITYTLNNLPNSAWKTYQMGVGDCVELSFLYVSMARSIGIPAWVEFGWLYTTQTWAEHAWVGTVIPTREGIVRGIIDLTEEVGTSDLGIGFFVRDPFRLLEWVDDGNSSHLTNYYTLLSGETRGNFYAPVEKIIPSSVNFGQYSLFPLPSYSLDPFIFRLIIVAVASLIIYYVVRRKGL